jgi:hypothetical protein
VKANEITHRSKPTTAKRKTACCYCQGAIHGKPQFFVPEGFACNPVHDGEPLCLACGGFSLPTLEQICEFLDAELIVEEHFKRISETLRAPAKRRKRGAK